MVSAVKKIDISEFAQEEILIELVRAQENSGYFYSQCASGEPQYLRVMEVDKEYNSNEMTELQNYFQTLTGKRTFPRVFIGGKCVGGADDTEKLDKNNELAPLIEQLIEKKGETNIKT
ncbi:hypothetical protein RFI_19803 [Reticulomyxa filosa]|uniref:Glutaredoxin domain-containing protein n=1 Tax=Reticulomyxa filosa TaxID=46433 RepID=X6MUM5_RETFI|nr:hypothetical protein RFI_19803 [Reticulomyxa filosa]|eukprot:ETO17519.1 hypothetical protein RFI_19803 [Reticulomyxa filosa]